jgi:two-component system response regulator YesN
MYKLIIVEDEFIMRKGLKETIPWTEMGIEVIGIAENGRSAWEMIQKEQPHIVLTDIRLPLMDGIELLKKIKNELPQTEVILLSAYEEFDYAKAGLEYGAAAYVLKLSIKKELTEAVSLVKDRLKELEKNRYINAAHDRSISENLPDGGEYEHMKEVMEYINLNFNRTSLKEVAHHFSFNPSHFSVMFKKHTGLTFSDYITRYRMDIAERMLKKGAKVQDTALKTGYSDVKHFRKVFIKNFGKTPNEMKSN